MSDTSIEWTKKTWNPLRGCTRISEGCRNCYAERMAARKLPELKSPTTGEPFAVMTSSGPRWTGKVELIESKLTEPLRWKKPQRVFVNSMSDLFHESVPDEWIDRIFAAMALCPQHTFQVLTKRADRMREYLRPQPRGAAERIYNRAYGLSAVWQCGMAVGWPYSHIWLGVSVEDQERADERRESLREVAKMGWLTWVSYEPALGPVDWRGWEFLDWLVIGGESGPGARPFNVDWARQTIRDCDETGVAPFVKQLGARPFETLPRYHHAHAWPPEVEWRTATEPKLRSKKGGDMSEWPKDLRIREYPEVQNGRI